MFGLTRLLTLVLSLPPSLPATPVQASGAGQWSEEATFPFSPSPDTFSKEALVDLRSLNEKVAGETGFIRVDSAGDFVKGDGSPLRIWAVNTGTGREKPFVARPRWTNQEPDLDRHARFLAKRGVNMIRLHTQCSPDLEKNPDAPITAVNQRDRDYIWRAVAAMKKQGIYSVVSPYWGVPMKFSKNWNYPGGTDQSALGLLFFDPVLQAAYKSWLKQIFTEKNPYTGIPLSQDPALAIIQIQNEDSLLFWTVNNIKGAQREKLQSLWFDWAVKKYKSIGAAYQAWGNTRLDTDQVVAKRLDFHNLWELTQQRTGGFGVRLGDQLQFWSETMHNFNADIVNYLRKDLGCKQLVNAGNWKTADAARLNDPERWSYTAAEVDAVNHYYGGIHKGPNEGWSIDKGDKITNPSVYFDPKTLPINLKQTANRPMMVTESGWVLPTGYSSEGPLTVSAYSGLNGVDAFFWFATGEEQWTPPQSANGYNDGTVKWAFGTPDVLGSFPAAALMHRMGYIKRGAPVVTENRTLRDLWDRRTPLITEEASFDPNRDTGDIAPSSNIKTGVNPVAYLMGPVQVGFSDKVAPSKVDVPRLEDPGIIVSNTGQISLNSRKGQIFVDTPNAQAVGGFTGGRASFKTSDLTVVSQNEYFNLIAVSLDGQPIKTSGKVLVQLVTRSRPSGWQDKPVRIKLDKGQEVDGLEVVSVGQAPWRVKQALAMVRIGNTGITKATALDPNMMAKANLNLTASASGKSFEFPKDALYVVLQK